MEQKLNFWANNLAKALDKGSDEAQVYLFALRLLVNTILGYIAIGLAAFLLGVLPQALTASVTTALLRVFSGGAHATSPRNCILSGAIIFPFLGILARDAGVQAPGALLVAGVLAWLMVLVIVYLYAPADTPGKPIEAPSHKAKLKNNSLLVLVAWLVLLVMASQNMFFHISPSFVLASILGLLWQGLSLAPLGYSLVARVDSLLNLVWKEEKRT